MACGAWTIRLRVRAGKPRLRVFQPHHRFFAWQGYDETDEVWGDGSAALEDDGFLNIALRFHHGDQATLKVQKC